MSASPHVVVVGAGHAGGRVAQHMKALGHSGRLTLIGDEPHIPYERPALSKELLLGKVEADSIQLAPTAFWASDALAGSGIERIHGRVSSLDVEAKALRLADGSTLDLDVLVVATGGTARVPAFVKQDLEGVHVLRTLDDCLALRGSLDGCRRLVIIGAGVIGMEVASTATSLGIPVTVLEAGPGIMGRCLPTCVAQWLAAQHVARGVDLRTGVSVTDIDRAGGPGGLALRVQVRKDGMAFSIDADAVLIAVGVDCNPAFLHGTGLSDERGVIVDEHCRSVGVPWLYAAGDAACMRDAASGRSLRQETWRNAENQARAVAEIIHGRTEPYRETPWMWTDQLGHNIQVTGVPDPDDAVIVLGSLEEASATVVSVRDGRVSAGVTVNQSRERRHIGRLVETGARLDVARLAHARVPLKEWA